MEKEEGAFVKAVVLSDPGGALRAALRNWGRQLVKISSHDPLRDPRAFLANEYWQTTRLVDLIPNAFLRLASRSSGRAARRCCGPRRPNGGMSPSSSRPPVSGLWRMSRPGCPARLWPTVRGPGRMRPCASPPLCAILIVVVVVNAGVCGVLSGAFSRYQARIVWLIPLVAGLIACALGPRPKISGAAAKTA